MSPQEKAYDIWQKMMNADVLVDETSALQCALVAVDEMIETSDKNKIVYTFFEGDCLTQYTEDFYWKKVKHEIEQL